MKDFIKKRLDEGLVSVNALGVPVSRPDKILIVMRGISGSGKSTRAKSIVGEGIIHSTDDLIEATGDYRGFFDNMVKENNFAPHSKMHRQNLINAKTSMNNGISPVIIDNTNIKANECKEYVKHALSLGYADKNIKFVDIGTGGLLAEELAERNTHGVPLKKIESMIQSHASVGSLTIKKVLESKDMFDMNKPLYSGIVLSDESKSKLVASLGNEIPKEWDIFAHHMTIVFGKGLPKEMKDDLGTSVHIVATEVGLTDMAMAVKVEGYPSLNDVPHITVAVNTKEGGTPAMSKDITTWKKLVTPINIIGVVTEVKPK